MMLTRHARVGLSLRYFSLMYARQYRMNWITAMMNDPKATVPVW